MDPEPTWLLKRAAEQFAPILPQLCSTSFQAGNLPLSQKHVLVSAQLKKSTLDPADLNSYRPISQLLFASKLVERAVALSTIVMSMDCCLPDSQPIPSLSFDQNGCRHRLQWRCLINRPRGGCTTCSTGSQLSLWYCWPWLPDVHPKEPILCCWRRVVLVPAVSIQSDADCYVWRRSQRPFYSSL